MKKILAFVLCICMVIVLGVVLSGCASNKDSIVFYVDGEKYATKKTITDVTVELPEDPIKDGYRFVGWYSSEDKSSSDYDIRKTEDDNGNIVGSLETTSNICNKYYAVFEKLYEITFDLSGGAFITSELEASSDDFILQEDGTYCVYEINGGYVKYLSPQKDGYTFKGWSLYDEIVYEADATDSYATVDGDACFVAVWEANEYLLSVYELETWNENYTIYNSKNYEFSELKSENERCDNEINLTFDLKDGYEFACWYNAGECWEGYYSLIQDFNPENIISTERNCTISMPTSNCCVVAIYYPYRFSTTIYGDEQAGTISQKYDSVIAKAGEIFSLTSCANDGYTFQGWYLNGTLLTKENTVNYEMTNCSATLTAKFGVCSTTVSATKKYSQTSNEYEDNSYIILPDDFGTAYATYTICAKLIDDYLFYGWYLNGEFLTQNLTLDIEIGTDAAEYVAKYIKCNTTFSKNIDDAGDLNIPDFQYYGQEVGITANVAKGHKFEGWYIVDLETEEEKLLTNNVLLEISLSDETKKYIAKYSENTLSITQNIEGAGTLCEGYKVTFVYGNGYENQIQIVNSKRPLTFPPKQSNYYKILVGWYLDEDFNEPFDWTSSITQDTVLYAKWESLTVPFYVKNHYTYTNVGETAISVIDSTTSNEEVCYYYSAEYDQTIHLQMLAYRTATSATHFHIYANVIIWNVTTNERLYARNLSTCKDYNDEAVNENLTAYLKRGDILRIECYFAGAIDGLSYTTLSASTEYFKFRIMVESEEPTVYGNVNCVNGHYHADESILLKTDLKEGYKFDGWYIGDVCIGTSLETEYIMPDTSVTVEARYSLIQNDAMK